MRPGQFWSAKQRFRIASEPWLQEDKMRQKPGISKLSAEHIVRDCLGRSLEITEGISNSKTLENRLVGFKPVASELPRRG